MIYLVRHGEAAAGWGTHPDPGLSENGQAQAHTVSDTLSGHAIQQAFTSPMQRCQETAAPFVASSQLPLSIEPRVTEIPTPGNVTDRIPWLRALMAGTWQDTPPIVQDWRNTLIETVSNLPEHSVVFSHFIAINAIVGHIEDNMNVTVFRPNYCSITRVRPGSDGLELLTRGEELVTKVL